MHATWINKSSRLGTIHSPTPQAQQGAILPLLGVGMIFLIAMAGLALDGGHMMLNKTRLQNTVDAAALTAAKTLNASADEGLATTAALALFAANAAATGNAELGAEYTAGGITVNLQFSSTLNPFIPGTFPAEYVRVRATGFTLPSWLIQVIGFNNKTVGATAVAGPSPTINNLCNLAPMMMCGAPDGDPPFYGYEENKPKVLKTGAPGGNCPPEDPNCVGPGNFQLIRLGGSGGAVVRENMAGSFDQCFAETDTVTTEPGNTVGPVIQGFNTRFDEFLGPMRGQEAIYPPDVIVEAPFPLLQYEQGYYLTEPVLDEFGQPVTEPVLDPVTGEPVTEPMLDPVTGEPMTDPVTGEPIYVPVPEVPVAEVPVLDEFGEQVYIPEKITSGEGGPEVTDANDLTFSYADYEDRMDVPDYDIQPVSNGGYAVYERRIISIPIGDCTGTINGTGDVPVLGFGCLFLLQQIEGNPAGQRSNIYGQFVESCQSGGVPGPDPGDDPGPYIIQLYKDPDATAS